MKITKNKLNGNNFCQHKNLLNIKYICTKEEETNLDLMPISISPSREHLLVELLRLNLKTYNYLCQVQNCKYRKKPGFSKNYDVIYKKREGRFKI